MDYLMLREHPEWADRAAAWFHEKWGIPLEAYEESMSDCLSDRGTVPQWYLAVEDGSLVGGLGVIENDFHERKDLTPNVCAVFVEPDHRCRGIAGNLLALVCRDMEEMGINTLYLLTNHTSFYERYGWRFLCMTKDSEGKQSRMYIHVPGQA